MRAVGQGVESITNGRDWFNEIIYDWPIWGPQLDALCDDKKEAIKNIPEFDQWNDLSLQMLQMWLFEEEDDPSVVDAAMEKVKAILAE